MTSTFSGPIRAAAKFFLEGDRKFFVKGVTYGPFRPDAQGHFLGQRARAERDLAQMREIEQRFLGAPSRIQQPKDSEIWQARVAAFAASAR